METVAFIFARGGSKGLPGKNLLPLMGKPLLGWAIEQAKAVSKIDRVFVSTDSEEIAQVAIKYGAKIPFLRPKELASDEASEWLAWRHALEWIRNNEGKLPDAMVVVPTTSPLRLPEDLEAALALFEKGDADAVITVTKARRNPCFNMVQIRSDGFVKLVIQPETEIYRRQEAPVFYDVSTVAYVVSPSFVLSRSGLFSGKIRAVQVSEDHAVDIDTKNEFEIAEFLMQKRLK